VLFRRAVGNKAVGKPKSFLEIQQEQESAFHPGPAVSAIAPPQSSKEQYRPKV